MPMIVAGVGFLLLFVCLYVQNKKNDSARVTKLDIEMFHDESWKPSYFGIKRSRSQVTTLPLAAYVSHAWFFLLQCPTTQASSTGFSHVTITPLLLLLCTWQIDWQFFCVWWYSRMQPAAKTLPAWVIALVWVVDTLASFSVFEASSLSQAFVDLLQPN